MSVDALGPVRILVDGRPVAVGGPRPRALVAILLAASGRPVSSGRLVAEMYEGRDRADSSATLRVHISNVRRALVGSGLTRQVIRTVQGGYALDLGPEETDIRRFDRLVRAAGESVDPDRALELIDRALGLWRGEPFEDAGDLPSVRPEAMRLTAAWRAVQADRAERQLVMGRHRQVVSDLERLVAHQPLDESFRRLLMIALYRSGRPTDALRCASDLRWLLRNEFGVEPGPALLDLERAVLMHSADLAWVPPARVAAPGPAVVAADSTSPAASLTGAGGSGHGADRPEPADIDGALPPGTRPWLSSAAVLGRPFTVEELQAIGTAVLPAPDPQAATPALGSADAAVASATRAGVIGREQGQRDAPERCWFTDDHTAANVYEQIDAFTRAHLHARIAALLDRGELAGGPDAVEELATHGEQGLASGLVQQQAVVWMERAAEAASAGGRHDAAVRWLTRALHVADTVVPIPSSHRSAIVAARGRALWRVGRAADARQEFHAVLDAARRSEDPLLLAQGALGMAGRFWVDALRFPTRSTEALAEVVTDALAGLPAAARVERALLLAIRACAHASLGDPEAAEEIGEAAAAEAARTDDPRTIGKVLAARASSLCLPGQLDAREQAVRRLRAVIETSGDAELAFAAGALALECHLDRDEPDAAKAELAALTAADAVADDPTLQHRLKTLTTVVAMVDHQWGVAEDLAKQALQLGRAATDEHDAFLAYMLQMAVLHYNRNDREQLDAIRSTLLADPERSTRSDTIDATWTWREPSACLFEAWLGRRSSARRRLRRLTADGCRLVPRNHLWLGNLAALVDAADFLEAGEVAQDLMVHLEPLQDRRVTVPGLLSLGPVPYYLGMLCRIQGRQDEAEHWLREAVDRITRSSKTAHPGPWVMASLSTVLSQHGDATVRAQAEEVAETAERLALEMGTRGALHRLPRT